MLLTALEFNGANLLKKIMSQDGIVDKRDHQGRTPLLIVAFYGKLDLMKRLVEEQGACTVTSCDIHLQYNQPTSTLVCWERLLQT